MDRGSLAKSLQNKETAIELDWTRRLNITKDVANALSYMHHDCFAPIVHRDVTSSNILLDMDFSACISDFDLAKVLDGDAPNCTRLAGTNGYLAPGKIMSIYRLNLCVVMFSLSRKRFEEVIIWRICNKTL